MPKSMREAQKKGMKEESAVQYWQCKMSIEEWWIAVIMGWTAVSLMAITGAIMFNAKNGWKGRLLSPFMVSNLSLVLAWAVCCPILGMKGVWHMLLRRKRDETPLQARKMKRHIKRMCCLAVTWSSKKKAQAVVKKQPKPSPHNMVRESVPLSPRTTTNLLNATLGSPKPTGSTTPPNLKNKKPNKFSAGIAAANKIGVEDSQQPPPPDSAKRREAAKSPPRRAGKGQSAMSKAMIKKSTTPPRASDFE